MSTTAVSKRPVDLPKFPDGKEFEEYVSAYLQCGPVYIERNIVEREEQEVLELDIIGTDYSKAPPHVRLFEIKSGSWGFADIFKIYGWLNYLGITDGAFVLKQSKNSVEYYRKKVKQLGIELLVLADLVDTASVLAPLIGKHTPDGDDIVCWRFSYWIERNLLRLLNQKKRSTTSMECYRTMEDYIYVVNSGSFFTESAVERAEELYRVFKDSPLLSAKCAREIKGGAFSEDTKNIPSDLFDDTFYKCKYTDFRTALYTFFSVAPALAGEPPSPNILSASAAAS
jgi:hypothetical protein